MKYPSHSTSELNVLRFVMSYNNKVPCVPRIYALVIERNLSCPAVSQNCVLIFLPSTWKFLVLKSTPMVVSNDSLKLPSIKRCRKPVLPTPESPIINILNV